MLSTILPIKALATKSVAFSKYLLDRWDIINDETVPKDLRDTTPILNYTADGKSKSSFVSLKDYLDRSDFNPAVLLASGLMPASVLLIAITLLLPQSLQNLALTLTLPLSLFVVMGGLWMMAQNRETVGNYIKSLTFGFFLPLMGLFITASTKGGITQGAMSSVIIEMARFINVTTMFQAIPGGLGMILLVLGGLFLASFFTPYARKPANIVFKVIMGLTVLTFFIAKLPSFVFPLTMLYACYAPMSIFKKWRAKNAYLLQTYAGLDENSIYNGDRNKESHIEVRKQQLEKAQKDKSPLIRIGKATGTLALRGSPYSPDSGNMMVMSVNDFSTHMVVIGETGTGKTAGVVKPTVVQWILSKAGGLCVYDGKSALAKEFEAIPNFIVLTPTKYKRQTEEIIEKGVDVPLIKHITPGLVSETLSGMTGDGKASKDDGGNANAQFFKESALALGRAMENLVWWLDATENYLRKCGRVSQDIPKQWHWKVTDIQKALVMASNTTQEGRGELLSWVGFVKNFAPVAERDPVLNASLDYIEKEIPVLAQGEAQWSGIVASCMAWFKPITSNRDLYQWADCADGIDPNGCCHGQAMGVYLPLSYGNAGKACQALIRLQQSLEIRQRPDKWRELDSTATPCLFVMDEAQEILNEADGKSASMGRSQGAYLLIATQSINALVSRFGENGMEEFTTNFGTMIVLRSNQDSFELIQKRIGKTVKRGLSTSNFIAVQSSLKKLSSLPVSDWGYCFGQKEMERLASIGVGLNPLTTATCSLDEAEEFDVERGGKNNNNIKDLGDEEWIVNSADFNALKKGEGYALAYIVRGGKPRQDFIHLTPMFDINPKWFS